MTAYRKTLASEKRTDHEVLQAILRCYPKSPEVASDYELEERWADVTAVSRRLGIFYEQAYSHLKRLWCAGLVVKVKRSAHDVRWHVRHGWPGEPHIRHYGEVQPPPKKTKDGKA